MPKSKRINADDASGDAGTKKVKLPADIDDFTIRWEVEQGRAWKCYAESDSELITQAYNNGQRQILITDKDAVNTLNMDKMVLKVKKSGWEKRLRCCIKDNEDYYTWQKEGKKSGKWDPFYPLDVTALEKAYTRDPKSMCTILDGSDVDLGTMKLADKDVMRVQSEAKCLPTLTSVNLSTNSSDNLTNGAPANGIGGPSIDASGDASSSNTKAAAVGKGKSGRAAPKGKSTKVKNEPQEEKSSSRTLIIKGKAPVDPECPKQGQAHVFYEGQDIYDVMLNQTNLQNNNNKYYLIQLLQEDSKNLYSVWMRWGRVGKAGQNSLLSCGPDLNEAKSVFCRKFQDKTRNSWADRKHFEKVPGKYDMLAMDYNTKDDKDTVDGGFKLKKEPTEPSKLDMRVQALVELICNVQAMEQAVIEMQYDSKRAPLGKLTTDQIKAGYSALKKIDELISKNKTGPNLVQACDAFYTRIPHDFGMKRPPLIRTKEEVRIKIQLLEALGDIQVAIKMLSEETGTGHPIDRHYEALKCKLEPLERNHKDFQMVERYVKNTHASTHSQYSLEVIDTFQCCKEDQDKQFKDLGNRMLLWHGSRLSNWVGILNQGLRIAPPEAPVTGYMFGKGIYFADMSSKSANYCFPSRSSNIGLVLLSEVSLGDSNELLAADYAADKLPTGKQSVKGLGKIGPDSTENHTMSCGTVVPLGQAKDTGIVNPNGYTLNYNEYIVYDTRQVRMRYLCKVKFNFK